MKKIVIIGCCAMLFFIKQVNAMDADGPVLEHATQLVAGGAVDARGLKSRHTLTRGKGSRHLVDRVFTPEYRISAFKNRVVRERARMERIEEEGEMLGAGRELLEAFSQILKSIIPCVRHNPAQLESVQGILIAVEAEIAAGNFDSERLEYLAQLVLDVVADDNSQEDKLLQFKIQFAAMTGRVTMFSKMIDDSGRGEDFEFTESEQQEIKVMGAEIVRIAQAIAAHSKELSLDQREELVTSAQTARKHLNSMASASHRNPQAVAKVAVWVVQGLVISTGILAAQVQKLSLADGQALIQQRAWYRKLGLGTLILAVGISAGLLTGNYFNYIDIQTIPSWTDLLASLTYLL